MYCGADTLCVPFTDIAFSHHLHILIGAFAVSFLVLIASVVLVSIVRSKYPYNKLAKTLGIVIAVTFFIEMFIFITLAVMCNMADKFQHLQLQQLPHTRLNDNYGDYYSMRKNMRDDHGY